MKKNTQNETVAHRFSTKLSQILKPRPVKTVTWTMVGMASCLLACSQLCAGALIIPVGAQQIETKAVGQPESFESYQIRVLRNQNQLQTEKIKVLRDELLELTHKLNELKPHLFKQGDPADQAKISDLTYQLGKKEEALNNFNSSKRDMEAELSQSRKRLAELETVKDALTDLVEKHRTAKEQSTESFKSQIDDLYTTTAHEKNGLVLRIQQHEALQDRLKQSVQDKSNTIERLDAVVSAQDAALAAKNQELLALEEKTLQLYDEIIATSQAYASANALQGQHIEALNNTLSDHEEQINQLNLYKEEMHWLSDIFNGTQTLFQDEIASLHADLAQEKELNAELTQLKSKLDQHRQELAVLVSTQEIFQGEQAAYINQLAATLEQEQNRTQDVQQQFLGLLIHQESSQSYAETLEANIAKLEEMLNGKQSELEAMSQAHADVVGNLLLHLDDSQMAEEHHAGYREALENYLSLFYTQRKVNEQSQQDQKQKFVEGHKEAYQAWHDRLAAVKEREVETIASLEELLASKQAELDAITQAHRDVVGGLLLHLDDSQLAEEHHAGYREALENFLAGFSTQRKVNEQSQQDQQEKFVEGHKQAYQIWHERLAAVNQAYKTREEDLRQKLSAIVATSNGHENRADYLGQLLNEANIHSDALAQQLATHQTLLQDKEAQIQAIEEARAASYHQLEQKVQALTAALDEKQRSYDALQGAHSEATADWKQQLENANSQLAEEHKSVETLRQQANEMVNNHASQLEQVKQTYAEEHDKFINLNLAHDYVKRELSDQIAQFEIQLAEGKAQVQAIQEELLVALAQVELEQGVGRQQTQKAQDLAKELEEKLHLLELSHSQASTTHLDNQQLTHQNVELLDQIAELEQKLSQEQQRSKSQESAVEQLQNDLAQAHSSLNNMDELGSQLQALQIHIKEHEEEVSRERAAHGLTKQENAAKLDELELYHRNSNGAKEAEIMRLKTALHEEKEKAVLLKEDNRLARLNYNQEHSTLRNLEQIIAEVTERAAAIEDQLAESRLASLSKEEKYQMLSDAHVELKENFEVLHQKLKSDLEQEKSSRATLQAQLERALTLYEEALGQAEENKRLALEEKSKIESKNNAFEQDPATDVPIREPLNTPADEPGDEEAGYRAQHVVES